MRLATVVAVVLALTGVARADGGAWVPIEVRVPILKRPTYPVGFIWQVQTEWWFTGKAHGASQIELRTGPILDVVKWFQIAARAADVVEKDAKGAFIQEVRAELEPTFKWRIWQFAFSNRTRLEYRWRETGDRFRARNQLRVAYDDEAVRWSPALGYEIFVDLSGKWVNEHRVSMTVAYKFSKDSKVEAGYMLQAKESTTWSLNHFAVLALAGTLDVL